MKGQLDLFSLGLLKENKENNTDKIKSLINRRRRQIIVHSCIYYKMKSNLIDDKTWDSWATELEKLHHDYPEISKQCVLSEAFKDFSNSTGFDLPLDDPWVISKAQSLLNYNQKEHYNEK